MKKILFFALMALVFSCSSDDDEKTSNANEKNIVGVWQEAFYWDRTDWHTWGLVPPPVWVFKSDKTYQYFDSMSKYQSGQAATSGMWDISDKYLTIGNHARKYSFSDDKQTLTWENIAILKRK